MFKMSVPTEEELSEFYARTYRLHGTNPQGNYPSMANKRTQVFRIARDLDAATPWMTNLKYDKALDIGCALGWSLKVLQFLEFDAYGVEPSEIDRKFAKEHLDLDLYETLEDLPDVKFDLINMAHVLEHIPRPVEYIRNLRENYLRHRGILLVEVPTQNALSGWSAFHTTIFNRDSLFLTFQKAGFQIAHIEGGMSDIKYKDRSTLLWMIGMVPDGPDPVPFRFEPSEAMAYVADGNPEDFISDDS
jgi:SAM-dependent methyltransferase